MGRKKYQTALNDAGIGRRGDAESAGVARVAASKSYRGKILTDFPSP